jgi:uncharacterized membrane protein
VEELGVEKRSNGGGPGFGELVLELRKEGVTIGHRWMGLSRRVPLGLATLLLFQVLIGLSPTYGHSKEKDKKAEMREAVVGDSTHRHQTIDQPLPEAQQPYVLRPLAVLGEHIHNKAIHAPIGLALAAGILSVVGVRRKELLTGIRWLVLLAAVSSAVAIVTGLSQAGVSEEESKRWVVELHELLGIATGGLLWLWTLFSFRRSLQRFAWVIGILVLGLVLITGFFGGILAHG